MARQRAEGVVVVVGIDSYLAEEATERLLTKVVGANRQDAVEVLHGDEATWIDNLTAECDYCGAAIRTINSYQWPI